VLTRLLESWLDSASERSYQAPFCQMLAAKGHTILHTTRHGALEFGKDVITRDAKGKICAYQLKGNPGTRMTLVQFRAIEGQLLDLMAQPVNLPGPRAPRHNAYVVTNGDVGEEIRTAVRELNRAFHARKTIGKSLEIIARGELLAWAKELGSSLWPSELENVNQLLDMLVADGREIFDIEKFHQLLTPVLGLSTQGEKALASAGMKRRITSAAILTGVSLRNFAIAENHFAHITAWVMFCAYAIAACERYSFNYARNAHASVQIAMAAIFNALKDLCEELRTRRNLIEGEVMADSFCYHGRLTLCVALMSVYWFWCEEVGWPNDQHRLFVHKFIPREPRNLNLWGEGALPQFLAYLWYLRATESGARPDMLLASLLRQVVQISTQKDSIGLAAPYYSFGDVLRHEVRNPLNLREDPFQGDSFRCTSYFALALMHLFVRTNLKQHCKDIWPGLSRLLFRHFESDSVWSYCLWRTESGREITVEPELTKDWNELRNEARDVSGKGIPSPLKENKFLLLLFVLLFPYRATPHAVRFLGRQFNGSWHIPDPLP